MSIIDTIRDVQSENRLKRVSRKYQLKIINPFEFRADMGQSFFILGSGKSINELSSYQWSEIEKGFSVGMNKWLIHDFIPDATSLEKNLHTDFYESIYSNYRLKNSKLKYIFYSADNILEYKGFPFHFEGEIMTKIRLHNYARKVIRNKAELDAFHAKPEFLANVSTKLCKNGINYEQVGSVYRLIQFALAAGYRHIVFCGVDLNNIEYFWSHTKYSLKRGLEESFKKEQEGRIHATELKINDSLPISEVIQSLKSGLHGTVHFETNSPNSKLAEFLNIWKP